MIKFAYYEWEFGFLKISYLDNCILSLDRAYMVDHENEKSSLSDLVYHQIKEYLQGKRQHFDFPFELRGTEFQKKVWQALCAIPYGETRSYKDIAIAIGNPKASRAIGLANNKNPISIVVPCHRVIGSNGKLVGYGGGLDMKEKLLELETKFKTK